MLRSFCSLLFSTVGVGGRRGVSTQRKVAVAIDKPCFPMAPADVDSPEFCLGLQTLLSLKVRHPCLGLTQNSRRGRRLRVEAQISLARKTDKCET